MSTLPFPGASRSPPASRKMGAPSGCPVGELLRFFGRPHVLDILHYFNHHPGSHRFVELQKALGLSPNTLSARLHDLVMAGFLTRTSFNEIPPRVDYEATAKSQELVSIFESMQSWARKHDLRPMEPVATPLRAASR